MDTVPRPTRQPGTEMQLLDAVAAAASVSLGGAPVALFGAVCRHRPGRRLGGGCTHTRRAAASSRTGQQQLCGDRLARVDTRCGRRPA